MDHETIGQVTDEVKEIFDIVLEASDIKVNKDGLRSHMIKRHHNDVIHHIEDLELILRNPDFVGVNPREKDSPSLKHTRWELLESSHLVFLFYFGFFLFVIRESDLLQIWEFSKLFKHLVQVVSFCKFYSHRCTSILNSTSIILLF